MIFDKDNACRVNKLSNEIGDQVRYILRSEVILPMYPRRRAAPRRAPLRRRCTCRGFTGSFESRTRDAKRGPNTVSRVNAIYISAALTSEGPPLSLSLSSAPSRNQLVPRAHILYPAFLSFQGYRGSFRRSSAASSRQRRELALHV